MGISRKFKPGDEVVQVKYMHGKPPRRLRLVEVLRLNNVGTQIWSYIDLNYPELGVVGQLGLDAEYNDCMYELISVAESPLYKALNEK